MKNVIALPVSIFLLFIILVSSWLYYNDDMVLRSPVLVAKKPFVNFTLGDVQYSLAGQQWEKLVSGMILDDNSRIQTGNNSKADISFSNGMTIRMEENTHLDIATVNINKKVLKMDKGSIYGHFSREHDKQEIRVVTPTVVASVRGTELGFEIFDVLPDTGDEPGETVKTVKATTVYTKSGIVEIWSPGREKESILLSHQKKSVIAEDTAPADPLSFTPQDTERIQNIFNSIHENEVIVISTNIRFDTNKAEIKSISHVELDTIAKKLNTRSEVVRIEGHTDDTGTASFNQELSMQRSEAIKKYLVTKGVSEKRLITAGFGSSRPVVPNSDEKNRSLNRRVEFTVVE